MYFVKKGSCVLLAVILFFLAAFGPIGSLRSIAEPSFEEQLLAFPESYRGALRTLHEKYPNWKFTADAISLTFDEAVKREQVSSLVTYKVVSKSSKKSWLSMEKGAYDWSAKKYVAYDTNWYVASREVIKYYMDPRNFLNADQIYAYMNLMYDANSQTEEGLAKIIRGTFLEKGYTDPKDTAYGGSYAKVIMAAAQQNKISPYVLAATILQEQGSKGESSLISGTYSGYQGYYNFFNIQTYGNTDDAKIKQGLGYAKEKGWNTRSASIIGGAAFCSNNYVSAGQNTYFYMNYNIKNPDRLWHQYATAVHNANSSAQQVAKNYKDLTNAEIDFMIPVYKSIPATAAVLPAQTDKQNNYYFDTVQIAGLTPSFDRYTYEYDLSVSSDSNIYIALPDGASYTGSPFYSLKAGNNAVNLAVKSASGYTNSYTINVTAKTACKLTVSGNIAEGAASSSGATSGGKIVMCGDTNGDAKVNIRDLANVQMHILEIKLLKGDNFKGGDTNHDGAITIRDLANVQLDILDIKKLN